MLVDPVRSGVGEVANLPFPLVEEHKVVPGLHSAEASAADRTRSDGERSTPGGVSPLRGHIGVIQACAPEGAPEGIRTPNLLIRSQIVEQSMVCV